jgi:transcriptional regulator GlxA family with amidase domain
MEKTHRHIAFLVMPNATLLDITGPYEAFSVAAQCLQASGKDDVTYILHTLSLDRNKIVKTSSGLCLQCETSINALDYSIDTLFIPGIPESLKDMVDSKTLSWIKQQSTQVRRICSICTGAFILAEAAILDNRKVATHWKLCNRLAKDYPSLKVDRESIFIKDGHVYTSAGVSSGIDLALALIEEDFGRTLALDVARELVVYLKRPGNQAQFSVALKHQGVDYQPIQSIKDWLLEHLKDRITIEQLAEQALMSPRNFARVFVKETGITPAKYIEKLRLEAACRFLTETQLTLEAISCECGLTNIDNMRRLFIKHLKVTPSSYRQCFRT